jgi:hypothetical protein
VFLPPTHIAQHATAPRSSLRELLGTLDLVPVRDEAPILSGAAAHVHLVPDGLAPFMSEGYVPAGGGYLLERYGPENRIRGYEELDEVVQLFGG